MTIINCLRSVVIMIHGCDSHLFVCAVYYGDLRKLFIQENKIIIKIHSAIQDRYHNYVHAC